MITDLRQRFRRQPAFPLTITGYGRVDHAHLPRKVQDRLRQLSSAAPLEWGLLFVLDDQGRRWTLYSADPEYTALFAPSAHTLTLEHDIFTAKFPCWMPGWRVV